jgi:ABC-type transport system involved in cytochrome bd biosynthesis fused ATPase/permease subunit
VVVSGLSQLAAVALVGGATGLLVWSARRPGLAAVAGLLVAVELIAFLRAPLRHAARLATHDLGLGGLRGWRTWLLDSVATWSPSRLGAARTGDLLARCLEDTDALQDLWVRVVVPAASSTCALVVASIALAAIEPLAGAAVAVATAIVALTTWRSASHVCALGAEEATLRGRVAARVVELALGADELALLGADAAHLEATRALLRRRVTLRTRSDAIAARLGFLASFLSAVALVVAACSAPLPTVDPARFAGVVVAILACGELLSALPATLEALGPVAGAAMRLGSLAAATGGGTGSAARGALVLDHVDVATHTQGPALLEGVALRIEPGRRVVVTGPTGVGKSALLAVAARLEAPRRGFVELADVDVAELEESSLRRRLSWLPEDSVLLEGRVRDVLDVGRNLGDEALLSALDDVGLTEALRGRGGLDATIATRASDLSVGEQRRLALARVLAGAPDVLVLDEPTAGLDETMTAQVLQTLDRRGAAVLVATHDHNVTESSDTHVVRDRRLEWVSRSAPPSHAPDSGHPSPPPG